MQCFLDFNFTSTGKPVAQLENTGRNLLVLLRLTNLWGYAWKGLRASEDHIAGRGMNSLGHYTLVHKFIPMLQAFSIPDAKTGVEKSLGKMEKTPAWQLPKVSNQKEVIEEARNKGRKVHFASLMDLYHLKNSELEPSISEIQKAGSYSKVYIVKDDSGSYSQNDSSEDHGYHLQVAMDKQQTQYLLIPKWKWKMLTNFWKFQNRSVQTFGFVYHDTNGLNHGPVWKTQLFLLSGMCTVILWQDYYGKGNLRKSFRNMAGRKFQIGNVSLYIVKKDYSYLCMWMT